MNIHINAVRQLLRPIARRVRMLATLVTVTGVDDTQPFQVVQLTGLAGERLSNVKRIQQWGSRGNPPDGATGLKICIGGAGSFPLLIAVESPGGAPGPLPSGAYEIYDANGSYFRLNNDGTFYLKTATSGVVDCPNVQFTGNANVAGNLVVQGTALFDQTVTVLGALEAEGVDGSGNSLVATGNVRSSTGIYDSIGSMQAMRVVYNGHTQVVTDSIAVAPTAQM